ncbi:TetR family transcriptional regulator [Streptomyces albidoflavus]|uniref:TetR family transcriptional regulator n=1 Tax=Streptomyces TaxID=1883 RepID=UPI000ABDE806|nr:TetR family transcriptional regulator [Streptomyces sp. KE1]
MLARERQPSQAQQRGAGRTEPRATGRGEGPLDPYRPSMYFYCGNEHAVVDAALRVLDERVLTPVRRAAGAEGARTEEVLAVFLDAVRDLWQDQGQLLVAACEFIGEDDETRDDWRAASVALGDALAPVVLRDRERGALPTAGDAHALVVALWWTVERTYYMAYSAGPVPPEVTGATAMLGLLTRRTLGLADA